MKTKNIFFSLLLIFFCNFFYSQAFSSANKKSNDNTLLNKISGVWLLDTKKWPTDSILTFNRKSTGHHIWTIKVQFYDNNDLVDSYTNLCGNDPNSHNITGRWKLDPFTKQLMTTIPLAYAGNNFQIIKLTKKQMVLKKLSN